MSELLAVDFIDSIEQKFGEKPSAKNRKSVSEWRESINLLIDKLNSLVNKKIYSRQ